MIGGDGWIKIEVTEEIISSMENLVGRIFFNQTYFMQLLSYAS